jgi:polysaccharide export outer membrane protein
MRAALCYLSSLIASCLLPIFLLSSCASAPPQKKESPYPALQMKEIESSRQVRAMNEKLLMSTLAGRKTSQRDYKIGPEDLLEISVFEEEKLNKTVRVSSQGNISLPLLGVLRVKGLTANELEKEVRDLLAEKYLQNPQVSIFIKEYRNQRISVIGVVEKPGVFEVTGQKTVLDMLALAQGLKEDAGQLLFLIRPPSLEEDTPRGKKETVEQYPQTFVIDLDELLIKGDMTINLPMFHGDIINVPASGKVFVGGEVLKPGGYPFKGKRLTLAQAIALAEGLRPEGNGAEAKIFRYTGKGNEKEIITVDIYAIQNGQAEDLYLKENDILFIPKSGVKNFLIGLRDTLKGLFGIGFSRGF